MAIPKLYLIKSQERGELVTIGVTGTGDQSDESNIVKKRIQDYQAGISDPSDVYETPGSYIFEQYLHRFFRDYRKNIPIIFKASNERLGGPREWFELQPNVVIAIHDAFSREHPTTVDQVNPDDLPAFLSGLFSAIQWEAKGFTVERMAEFLEHKDPFSVPAENWQLEPSVSSGLPLGLEGGIFLADEVGQSGTKQPETRTDLPHHTADIDSIAPVYVERQRLNVDSVSVEMEEMRYMKISLTMIAIAGGFCATYLAATGASLIFFLICIFSLLALWPHVYPHVAINAIGLWRWMEIAATRSPQAGQRYE